MADVISLSRLLFSPRSRTSSITRSFRVPPRAPLRSPLRILIAPRNSDIQFLIVQSDLDDSRYPLPLFYFYLFAYSENRTRRITIMYKHGPCAWSVRGLDSI